MQAVVRFSDESASSKVEGAGSRALHGQMLTAAEAASAERMKSVANE